MPLSPRRAALLEELAPLAFPHILGVGEEAARVYAETWTECADEVRRHGMGSGLKAVKHRAASLEDGAGPAVERLAHVRRIAAVEAEADAVAEAGGHTQSANLAALAHLFENGAGRFIGERADVLNWRLYRASVCRRFVEAVEAWGPDALDAPPLPPGPTAAESAAPDEGPTERAPDGAASGPASSGGASARSFIRRRSRYECAAWMLDTFEDRPFDTYTQAWREAERRGLPSGVPTGEAVVTNAKRLLLGKDFGAEGVTPLTLMSKLRERGAEIRKRLADMG